jgi:hypothetical protein
MMKPIVDSMRDFELRKTMIRCSQLLSIFGAVLMKSSRVGFQRVYFIRIDNCEKSRNNKQKK